MKVFVFGAGASVGSQEGNPAGSVLPHQRAPLVNQLFDPVYRNFASDVLTDDDLERCRRGVQETGSLEEWLTAEWLSKDKITSQRYLAAEQTFFGRVTIYVWRLMLEVSKTERPVSGYSLLMNSLRRRRDEFGIISFNYETLLDKAFESVFGAPLQSFDAYLSNHFVKPHGSVNWFFDPRSDEADIGRGAADLPHRYRVMASIMFRGDPYRLDSVYVHDPQKRDLCDEGSVFALFSHRYFTPLLFIPLTTKLYAFVDSFYEQSVKKAQEMIALADEIYLIGYRANDDIIFEMLRSARPQTKLCAVSTSHNSASALVSKVIERHTKENDGVHVLAGNKVWGGGFLEFASNY